MVLGVCHETPAWNLVWDCGREHLEHVDKAYWWHQLLLTDKGRKPMQNWESVLGLIHGPHSLVKK